MNEGDSLSFGAGAGFFVHQLDAGVAALRQRTVQIVHRKADVMDSRPPLCEKLSDRGGLIRRFKQLDQRAGGIEAANAGPIRIGQGNFGEAENFL